jgi:hypothetical protein
LRDLHALKRDHSQQPEVVAWAQAVKALYRRATRAARWLRAAQRPPPTRAQLYDQLDAAAGTLGAQYAQTAGHPCHALARRLLRHQGEVFTFVRRDDVPAEPQRRRARSAPSRRRAQNQRGHPLASRQRHPHGADQPVRDVARPRPPSVERVSPTPATSFTPSLSSFSIAMRCWQRRAALY